jgi:hypothetical protein
MLVTLSPIELDVKNELERQFLDWYDSNADKTKELVLSGFHFIQNGVSSYYENHYKTHQDQIWRDKCEQLQKSLQDKARFVSLESADRISTLERLLSERDAEFKRIQTDQIAMIKQQYETDLDSKLFKAKQQQFELQLKLSEIKQTYQIELDTKLLQKERHQMQLQIELQRYKEMYEQLTTQLVETQVSQLNQQLQERDQEISILKRTNCGKGNLGENMIMTHLRTLFPTADVADSSKIKQSTDIHMKLDNSLFAFESKYKETITQQDIDKFYRDVEQLILTNGDAFMGAAFISLKSCNIPTKGDLYFDQVKNRPILFIGFNDGLEADLFGSMMRLLVKIGYYNQTLLKQETSINDLIEKMRPTYATISRTRSNIENIKQMASKIIDSTLNLERDISNGLSTLHTIIGETPQIQQDTTECPGCKKKYQNLKNHMRSCKLC